MKKISVLAVFAIGMLLTSCDNDARYIDLNTGKRVELVKDESTGLMVNSESKQPVYIYVDTKTRDTIYGRTGKVINGNVVKVEGEYKYDNDNIRVTTDVKSNDGDYKKEVEKDGDIKIKDGNKKIKIDGETGEKKVKTN